MFVTYVVSLNVISYHFNYSFSQCYEVHFETVSTDRSPFIETEQLI